MRVLGVDVAADVAIAEVDTGALLHALRIGERLAVFDPGRFLEIEREIKRLHIGLAVRLKNRLTPEQQEQLNKMELFAERVGFRTTKLGPHNCELL